MIRDFKRHFSVEHMSVQNLMCQSVTVTVQELLPTSLECLSFPPFSLVDSGTSRELGVEGEHTVQFFIQIQKDKPSEMLSMSVHSSMCECGRPANSSSPRSRICSLPDTRK